MLVLARGYHKPMCSRRASKFRPRDTRFLKHEIACPKTSLGKFLDGLRGIPCPSASTIPRCLIRGESITRFVVRQARHPFAGSHCWQWGLEDCPRDRPNGYNGQSMAAPLSNMIDRSIVRVFGFTMLLSAFSLRASAEDFTDAIHAYLQQCFEVRKIDGGCVVGLVDERGSRVVSYGKLDNGTDQEIDGDTLFEIGSVTKTFTALLLADMVERGQMKLDDPLSKYLPEAVKVPARNSKEITLLQLATHTSGLPREPTNLGSEIPDNPCAGYTVEKLDAFLSGYKLMRDPGERFEYSNPGVAALAQAIALKAGTDYESLVVERICRPLKMDSTRITLTPELKARFAAGHSQPGFVVPRSDFGALAPVGELRSTANDMLKYVSANLGLTPTNVSPIMRKTQQVHVAEIMPETDIGLAWTISRGPLGTKIIGHNGGTNGFLAYVGFEPARRRGVVVLASSRGVNELLGLGSFLLSSQWQTNLRPVKTEDPGEIDASYLGQYERSLDELHGMLKLRQLLQNSPKAATYVVTGVCFAMLGALVWRTGSSRKPWLIRGGALGLSCVLLALVALASTPPNIAPDQPGVGIRREMGRLFAQAIDPRSASVDVLLPPIEGELLPESAGRFFERLSGTPITFCRDAQGKVAGLTFGSLGNTSYFEKVSSQLADAPKPPKRPVAVKLEAKLLDACVGRYEFGPGAMFPAGIVVTIWRDKDRLIVHEEGENAVPGAISFYPESEASFFTKIDPAQLTFVKNDQGEVTAAIIHAPGLSDYEGKKQKK
jgi:D-alanyl-D-alanine-carboxypeptidase/D-alanyl-D-alanine-endopeptidase